MKLQARFVQLPIAFDADLLAQEIARMGEDAWRPHPQGFAGNDFLPLISAGGDPADEAFEGPMRPTPYLEKMPYLVDALAAIGATLGRTRLMRLAGQAEVTPHVDSHYYWRDRMRVHVPIVTQPTVAFHCGDSVINMKAGECWIFDTWSRHRVLNDDKLARTHLVADTVGGEGFWNLACNARAVGFPSAPTWEARKIGPTGGKVTDLDLESFNAPLVMSPWEAQEHIGFIVNEALPQQPAIAGVQQAAARFTHVWKALWSAYGEHETGWTRYRQALDQFAADLKGARAESIQLVNGLTLMAAITQLVLNMALADKRRDTGAGEQRNDPAAMAARGPARLPSEPDPVFDRPVFIVNPPRSGSSLLFETLAQTRGVVTVGGESHAVIEGVPALHISARDLDSNRLRAADATPEVVTDLRERFFALLRDRDGKPPAAGRVRMLEKTPKNALRIPFLAKAFPEARFIYLHRDPREVIASMMEAWESGRFRTYPNLPGWRGDLPWSLLLTPGWRDLASLPLNERVAAQWSTTMQILLDDLDQIRPQRVVTARYDALISDPTAEVRRLCAAVDLEWDRALGNELPIASHTVSKPRAEKWREREAEVEAVLPGLQALIRRAAAR